METYAREIALIAAAYALGCLSTGYYLVRLRSGADVRSTGSGNIGARNVGRLFGKWGLAITLVGDTAKGAAPVALASLLDMESWAVMAVLLAAVAGHLWPAQLGFRGGKGLATTMGAVLVLDFRVVLAAFAVAGIAWLITRNSTVGGLAAVLLSPLAALVAGHDSVTTGALAVLAAAIMFAHRANLQAMFQGTRTAAGEEA